MTEPILDPNYWRRRLNGAIEKHHAIFITHKDIWEAVEERHRILLRKFIQPRDSILDVGCGWGRLLTLLPLEWKGKYFGFDISPDFIRIAKARYPFRKFEVNSIEKVEPTMRYDVAILISMRPMIINNLGMEAWENMHAKLVPWVNKILYLEYTVDDEGELEVC